MDTSWVRFCCTATGSPIVSFIITAFPPKSQNSNLYSILSDILKSYGTLRLLPKLSHELLTMKIGGVYFQPLGFGLSFPPPPCLSSPLPFSPSFPFLCPPLSPSASLALLFFLHQYPAAPPLPLFHSDFILVPSPLFLQRADNTSQLLALGRFVSSKIS